MAVGVDALVAGVSAASHWPRWAVTGIPSTTTMLAHGRLLVDDPERIGPDQAIGMDQTLFNREYRTQQWATTFDSPPRNPKGRVTTEPQQENLVTRDRDDS